MKPDYDTYRQWSLLRSDCLIGSMQDGYRKVAKILLSDDLIINAYYLNTSTHGLGKKIQWVRFHTTVWSLDLLMNVIGMREIRMTDFTGDVNAFNFDTTTAKMIGYFDEDRSMFRL